MDWYDRRRAEQLAGFDRTCPAMSVMLRELNAVHLFGTLGMDAVMRADGVVLVAIDEHWGEPDAPEPTWREATLRERTLAMRAASERWPEVAAMLPLRPSDARDCPECGGRGTIAPKIYCGACGALGWIDERAI